MPVASGLVTSSLVTGLVVTFLYGIFFILFIASTYFLFARHARLAGPHDGNKLRLRYLIKPTILFNILMFICVTLNWVFIFVRMYQGFLGETPPDLYYGTLASMTALVKTIFMALAVDIGDAMIVYRVWVVWGYNYYIIIPPGLCLLGFMIGGFKIIDINAEVLSGRNFYTAPTWMAVALTMSLCVNFGGSALILYRIWKIKRNTSLILNQRHGASAFLMAVVESSGVSIMWTTALYIAYFSKTDYHLFFLDGYATVSGIAFMLINVRVGLGWAIQPPTTAYSTFHLSNVFPRRTPETTQHTRSLGLETSQEQVSLPEKPIVVSITSSQMVSSDRTMSETVDGDAFKAASAC